MIRTPKYCLICGSPWRGGHAKPLEAMRFGARQFYECGASISVSLLNDGIYMILVKNCWNDESQQLISRKVLSTKCFLTKTK
jgi:hypothetical protein